MSEGIMLSIGEDGIAREYGDTYDITIHCESREEQKEAIKSLESKPHWIPCSERLPEAGKKVICQCQAEIIKLLELDSDRDWQEDADHIYMNEFVIAWMPLPEPYKGE